MSSRNNGRKATVRYGMQTVKPELAAVTIWEGKASFRINIADILFWLAIAFLCWYVWMAGSLK